MAEGHFGVSESVLIQRRRPQATSPLSQSEATVSGRDHHADLHLRGYRNVTIELSTHDLGGLSENDFIVAAKINQLRVELKK